MSIKEIICVYFLTTMVFGVFCFILLNVVAELLLAAAGIILPLQTIFIALISLWTFVLVLIIFIELVINHE